MIELFDKLPDYAKPFREVFAATLDRKFAENDKLIYLDADLVSAIKTDVLFEKYPSRAINCGIAEANMMGTAAGLSSNGFIPFVHTFGCFATRRAFDQVFLSIAYADCPVKIIGSDPGVCAELNGGTHMPFEDMALMRSVPTMMVIEPCDATSLEVIIDEVIDNGCPVYIRLPRKRNFYLYKHKWDITIGKANILKEGSDVTLIACGIMVEQALIAAANLEKEGISAKVIDMHTIKPLDEEAVLKACETTGAIVTCENHNIIGGLFSAVCDVVCRSLAVPVEPVGVLDQFGEVGPIDYLQTKFGLTAKDIEVKAKFAISRKS